MDDGTTTIAALRERVADFVAEREWAPFHHPKDLAVGLAIEAAELLEAFQWESRDAAALRADPVVMAAARDEMADVLHYLLNLANVLEVDLAAAFTAKMAKNAARYPVETARGSAAKH